MCNNWLGLDTELDTAKGMDSITLLVESPRIASHAWPAGQGTADLVLYCPAIRPAHGGKRRADGGVRLQYQKTDW